MGKLKLDLLCDDDNDDNSAGFQAFGEGTSRQGGVFAYYF